ncbi:MAG TPA: hypothetical protein VGQ46_18025 [Thermoanaerobaculia bacterium]|jgi:type IV secretory pathway TrbL component|nr:hypothetical protein [Thermoanaerobaculia bacterium]
MRRLGNFAVCALFVVTAASAAETKTTNAKQAPVRPAAAVDNDSPLVRAAKISYQARLHPKSRVVIDSTTLVISRWPSAAAHAAAGGPDAQGRSWASGNSGDASAIAAQERSVREQRAAAEQAHQTALRQEQSYMAQQNDEPYSEVIDDHVTKRLETIPTEMTQKPPM